MTLRALGLAGLSLSLAIGVATIDAAGQGRGGRGQATPPQTARQAAPVDLSGTWVSVVSEDWRWRMVTPPKGDVASIPVNAEGRKAAQAGDPAADNARGNRELLNLVERHHPERRKRGSTTGSRASARSMKASAVMTIRMPGGSTHHQ